MAFVLGVLRREDRSPLHLVGTTRRKSLLGRRHVGGQYHAARNRELGHFPFIRCAAARLAAWLVGQARPAYDLPYLVGRESADSYYRTLAATSDLYRACESLRSARAGSRALFFWDDRGYFCPVPYLPDHLVPISSNAVLHRLPAQPEALLARLRELRVTHLVINRRAWKGASAGKLAWPFGETLARLLARPELRRFGPERCDVEVWEIDGAAR